MAVSVTKSQVLSLYRSLIRESKKFPSYNFRMYALRKVRDSFRTNQSLTDPAAISDKYLDGVRNLKVVKRQVVIGQLYSTDKLVIENLSSTS